MERTIDAIKAYQTGFDDGVSTAIKLINKYCELEVQTLPKLVIEINRLQSKNELAQQLNRLEKDINHGFI